MNKRHAVRPIHDLVRDLLWQRLAAGYERDHLGALPAGQTIEREHRHMRAPDPGRRELWPEGEDHQYPQRGHPINEKVEELTRGGIAPVHVLPHHQHWLTRRQPFELRKLGVKRLLLALLGREIERRIAVARRNRQQIRQQRNDLAEIIGPWARTASSLASRCSAASSRRKPAARSSWAMLG